MFLYTNTFKSNNYDGICLLQNMHSSMDKDMTLYCLYIPIILQPQITITIINTTWGIICFLAYRMSLPRYGSDGIKIAKEKKKRIVQ